MVAVYSTLCDTAVVCAAAAGDLGALGRLAADSIRYAFRVTSRHTSDWHLAEEAAADAAHTAISRLGSLQQHDRYRTWLATIAVRKLTDKNRPSRPVPWAWDGEIPAAASPPADEELLSRLVDRPDLVAAFRQLPPRQRSALYWVAVEGYDHATVADALGISEGACRQLVHRAKTSVTARVAYQMAERDDRSATRADSTSNSQPSVSDGSGTLGGVARAIRAA